MSDIPPASMPLPPRIGPDVVPGRGQPPLSAESAEHVPLAGLPAIIEAILREPRRVVNQLRQPSGGLIGRMVAAALLCSIVYGLIVGTFSMGTQLWAAPAKVAGGLLITAAICFPSLYIFTCLAGSQARLAEVSGLLAGLLLLMGLLLVGFAPVAWLFSQSTESLAWMGTLHLAFWFIATCFGLRFLTVGFSQFRARSNAGLATWIIIFILVAVQMTTALRPLVGKADTFLPQEKKFFVGHWRDCLKTSHRSAP